MIDNTLTLEQNLIQETKAAADATAVVFGNCSRPPRFKKTLNEWITLYETQEFHFRL